MYEFFIDLDGVLADFDSGVLEILGKEPKDLHPGRMWSTIARTPDFYANLKWMHDGKQLWDFVSRYTPTILTGLPRGTWAEPQKRAWCARELGANVPVITCMSRDKAARASAVTPSGRTMLLVDDRERLREAWEAAGGVFIFHESSDRSIATLEKLLSGEGGEQG